MGGLGTRSHQIDGGSFKPESGTKGEGTTPESPILECHCAEILIHLDDCAHEVIGHFLNHQAAFCLDIDRAPPLGCLPVAGKYVGAIAVLR